MSPAPRFIKARPQARVGEENPFKDSPPSVPETDTRLDPDMAPGLGPVNPTPSATATIDVSGMTPSQSGQLPQLVDARLGISQSIGGITTIARPRYTTEVYMKGRPDAPRAYGFPLKDLSRQVQEKVSENDYEAEYWTNVVKNPVLRKWWAERAVAMGLAAYDPTAPDYVAEKEFSTTGGAIYQMWNLWGQNAMLNPTVNTRTPEELLNAYYNSMGGSAAFEAAKAAAEAATPSPIQTTKQISTYTMSKAQADAIADSIATQVLGHMASDEEMKKARSAMNGMLKANPTVTTTTSDNTDVNNQVITQHTKAGVTPDTAAQAYEMKLQRSSEGMAFNVGKLMEDAMMKLDQGLV
jgi:hypothetical protein